MDILHLVDRLEELFNNSRAVWFTHNVIVDEDEMLAIIDQMRVSIPEEIKKAQQLLNQRDRMLAQAQEEANRIVELARQKTEQMAEKDQIVQMAQHRADQILDRAQLEADNMKADANDYVIDTLGALELQLSRSLNQVQNGIRSMQEEMMRKQMASQPPQPPAQAAPPVAEEE